MGVVLTLSTFNITYTDDEYNDLMRDFRYISPGTYNISTQSDESVVFGNIYVDFEQHGSTVYAYTFYDNDKIVEMCSPGVLTSSGYIWRISLEYGGYIIKYWYDANLVWTYVPKTGSVYLSTIQENNPNQLWNLDLK